NPRNWTSRMRWTHTAIACFTAFVCTLASTIVTPSQSPAIKADSASTDSVLPTSLFVFGLVFGPLLSDMGSEAFGRKVMYLTTLPLFAMFVLATAFENAPAGFLAFRFFSGLSCAPLLHLGFGTIFDIWTGRQRSSALTIYVFSMLLGVTFGPVIGGYIDEEYGIRGTQYVIIVLIVVCMLPTIFMKETAKEAINRRKAGSSKPLAVSLYKQRRFTLRSSVCLAPLRMLVKEPILVVGSAYAAYHLGVLYDICIAFPDMLRETHHFKPSIQGLSFVSMSIGVTIALALQLICLSSSLPSDSSPPPLPKTLPPPPEWRLKPVLPAAFFLTISLFILGWTTTFKIHWFVPLLCMSLYAANFLIILISTLQFLLESF
ncbi:hypothetical protein CERZMDRAFT_20326, partial [Cercospora zeae-maydis SCOH1-5]